MASKISTGPVAEACRKTRSRLEWAALVAALALAIGYPKSPAQAVTGVAAPALRPADARPGEPVPPRIAAAQRFLARRGLKPGQRLALRASRRGLGGSTTIQGSAVPLGASSPASAATWQPLGPVSVATASYGLVTGRISSIAIDPSDPTGNHVYIGTTGGGVWETANAAASNPALISFTPLTDNVSALSYASDASISIGAVAVQPGGTGVILAGTGDPNDVLDSYYGAGILRSTDGGTTWSLIVKTRDVEDQLGLVDYRFVGEGFAGFAWSTANTGLVVAAVSQAYEGVLVNGGQPAYSYEGLYYSQDAGATWHLATITDGNGQDVQGPLDAFDSPDGNAATAVMWNPVRKLFVAAVRYHGFYQSADGVTWTRLAVQPLTGIAALSGIVKNPCPNNAGQAGSIACPIYRAALAVNPVSGDTFAWSVDRNNQDQGLWQDQCSIGGSTCSNATLTFAKQWNTAALETGNSEGAATILNGNYSLALAAVPQQQDTLVLAGTDDLWKCNLAMGCTWRNATNASTCTSAQVAPFQHALAWNAGNPDEILIGNDSGLWRSMDAIGETGSVCSASDASHFQNLNGSLGSLAEVESISAIASSPYAMMAGLGVNGTAGVKASTAATDWSQVLTGFGGPVAVDTDNPDNWYVNAGSGVEIYLCSQTALCTPSDFGASPAIGEANVSSDGIGMGSPAPFLVDPLDSTQLLIGTCRLWRGPASGVGWGTSDAVTPILASGASTFPCGGEAFIRSMAAMALPGGSEIVYLGMYGENNGGANLPGHILSVVINPASSAAPVLTDLTLGQVANDINSFNKFGYDVSSISIDSHDATGNTVYATVAAFASAPQRVQTIYRSTDGGAHWSDLESNLPNVPVNDVAVDPDSAITVYVATDQGVFFTPVVSNCTQAFSVCWSPFGAGLPNAPVVALKASPASSSTPVLAAATYGRGIYATSLWSASAGVTTVLVSPTNLTFGSLAVGTSSAALTVAIQNNGSLALLPVSIAIAGDFTETDNCVGQSIAAGASCTMQVTFIPSAMGTRTGELTFYANVYGGQLQVDLGGTGAASSAVTLSPNPLSFGSIEVRSSQTLSVTAANASPASIPITSLTITGPFAIVTNSCGTTALAASADCQIQVSFNPVSAGAATGTLTLADGAGTQSIDLTGTGLSEPTDTLSPSSLTFAATQVGLASSEQSVTLTNSGGVQLTSISVSVSTGYQVSSNCTTQLAANSTCAFEVTFAPIQVGSQNGTLTVSDLMRTQTIPLSGTGLAPGVIAVSPASLTFGNQQANKASAPQTITVTNSGSAPIANLDFALAGLAATSYTLQTVTCGASLAANASCYAQVIFTPSGTGPVSAVLNISSSTLGVNAVSVPLNGSGSISNGVTISPGQIAFGVLGVGQSSPAQSVTITNSTSDAISSLSLAATAPFTLASNSCAGSLAPGANCAATVVFSPAATGPATGTLTINSPGLNSALAVALTGTGFSFTVSTTGSASQAVAAGQTAGFSLAIAPTGAPATFNLACGSLPKYAACAFNPATETLNSGVEGNVAVNITTGAVTSGSVEPVAGWGATPLICGLLLLPFALGRRRRGLLMAVSACILAAGITACTSSGLGNGGSGQKQQTTSTPAGTYTIPVSVTANGMSQTVTLTLTVD